MATSASLEAGASLALAPAGILVPVLEATG